MTIEAEETIIIKLLSGSRNALPAVKELYFMVNTIQMTQTGYLSENSEYDAAKNEQAEIEARIAVLEEQLKHVTIVDTDSLSLDMVGVGSKVKVLDMDMEEEGEYLIVGAMEVGHEMNTISDQSPVGHALIGHKKGEIVTVEAPGGAFEMKILDISK